MKTKVMPKWLFWVVYLIGFSLCSCECLMIDVIQGNLMMFDVI